MYIYKYLCIYMYIRYSSIYIYIHIYIYIYKSRASATRISTLAAPRSTAACRGEASLIKLLNTTASVYEVDKDYHSRVQLFFFLKHD